MRDWCVVDAGESVALDEGLLTEDEIVEGLQPKEAGKEEEEGEEEEIDVMTIPPPTVREMRSAASVLVEGLEHSDFATDVDLYAVRLIATKLRRAEHERVAALPQKKMTDYLDKE